MSSEQTIQFCFFEINNSSKNRTFTNKMGKCKPFDFFIKSLKASFKITVGIIQQDLRVRNTKIKIETISR